MAKGTHLTGKIGHHWRVVDAVILLLALALNAAFAPQAQARANKDSDEFALVTERNAHRFPKPKDPYADLLRQASFELTSQADFRMMDEYIKTSSPNERVNRILSVMTEVERHLMSLGWRICGKAPPPSIANGFTFAYVSQRCFVSAVGFAVNWVQSFLAAPLEAQSVIYAYYWRTLRELKNEPLADL